MNVKAKGKNFRAMLVPVGEYDTIQQDIDGTPVKTHISVPEQRAKRWQRKFETLRKQGVKFPVPWGHRVDAIPIDEKVYLSSLYRQNEGEFARNNASYIEKLEADKDGLWFEAEVPPGYVVKDGALVNEKEGTKAADFSAGIGDWIDNKGEEHTDVIIHAAIVPLAVCSNNHQVVALSSNRVGNVKFTATLSANQRSKKMVPEKDEDKKKPVDDESAPLFDESDSETAEEEDSAEGADEPEVASAPAPVESNVEMGSEGGNDDFREVTKILRDMGLDVPQDLAESEGWKWLCTALRVAASMGAKFVKPNDSDGDGEGEGHEKSTMEEPEVNAENPPILMSSNITDPFAKKLALKEQERMRGEFKDLWTKAQKAGCPSHIADRESKEVSKVFLSMNAKTGNFQIPSALAKVKLVAEILEAIKDSGAAHLTAQLSTAHVNQPNAISAQNLVGDAGQTDADKEYSERLERALKRGAAR